MKQIIFVIASSLLITSGIALADTGMSNHQSNHQQMHFEMCSKNSQWFNNWGQYVVAFEIDEARKACGQDAYPKTAPCKLHGHWVSAGYYCEEFSPGGGE